jgi:hypothetical protein
MSYRVVAAAACVLAVAGCQQAGPGPASVGVTAPSSVTMKAVDVPFSGAVTGGVVFGSNIQNCPAGFTGVITATGTALHMGQVALHTEQCINPTTGVIDGRVLVLTAANGDELHGTFAGQSESAGAPGDQFHVTATFVFEGGTGRFEHASGTAAMTAEVTHAATFPWPGRWEWKGMIRY